MSAWSTFVITLAGLVYLYLRNGATQGRHILQRYFPLSVTVGWKFVVIMVGLLWVLGWAQDGASAAVRGWTSTVSVAVLNVAMFWRIGTYVASLTRTHAA
ncbi:MAG: hypothetical protein IT359_10735 [Gemmatimonadaceae bacterium]|nr:hypothetical protein [Gemmatimonadaceae bacterium]